MNLLIRSQDRDCLNKVDYISVIDNRVVMLATYGRMTLGVYKTKERALEVLDEIQNKIKPRFILKSKSLLKLKDIKTAKNIFEKLNGVDFTAIDNHFEIEPIATNVMVYEMPKE